MLIEFRSIVRCFYCQSPFTLGNRLTTDHIIPKALGGSNRVYNKLNCCRQCNSFKSDLLPHEFYEKVLKNDIEWASKPVLLGQIQKTINYVKGIHKLVKPYSVKEAVCLTNVSRIVNPKVKSKNRQHNQSRD